MEITEIIEELERELDIKKGIFSKKIDIDNCLELLEHLKGSVALRIDEADEVIEKRGSILRNADIAAKNTIKEAEKRAVHTMGNNELIYRAEREGDKIVEAAYEQSENIIRKTKEHLDNMFKEIEDYLLSNLSMIRKNREELRNVSFVYSAARKKY